MIFLHLKWVRGESNASTTHHLGPIVFLIFILCPMANAGLEPVPRWSVEKCSMEAPSCPSSLTKALGSWELAYGQFNLFGPSFSEECEDWKANPALGGEVLNRIQHMEKQTYESLRRMKEAEGELSDIQQNLTSPPPACAGELQKAQECMSRRQNQVLRVMEVLCSTASS